MTEYGGPSSGDASKIGNISNQLDIHRGTSGTLWDWKENGGWGMFEQRTDPAAQSGPLYPVRVQINSRIYARAVIGSILQHDFDRFTGAFHLKANSSNQLIQAAANSSTEIYIPPHLHSLPPIVMGEAKLKDVIKQPDGSRIVQVAPAISGGVYRVIVGSMEFAEEPDFPTYQGVSQETMERVGESLWPLNNNGSVPDSALAFALAQANKEMYPDGTRYQLI